MSGCFSEERCQVATCKSGLKVRLNAANTSRVFSDTRVCASVRGRFCDRHIVWNTYESKRSRIAVDSPVKLAHPNRSWSIATSLQSVFRLRLALVVYAFGPKLYAFLWEHLSKWDWKRNSKNIKHRDGRRTAPSSCTTERVGVKQINRVSRPCADITTSDNVTRLKSTVRHVNYCCC